MAKKPKQYYWLKLKDDFFRQKEIKKLRKIAGGDTYTIIYLKMLLLAIKEENKLYFEGVEDEFADELALELDEDGENVAMTLAFLDKHNLIEIVNDEEFFLPQAEEMTGSESESAARVRRHREKKKMLQSNGKALQCNTDVTPSNKNVTTEIEIEIEKDKEIEKDIHTDIDSKLVGKFAKLYENNIGVINGVTSEWLIDISKDIDYSLFKRAIEICTERSKTNLGYLKGIINNWTNNNITTYDQLKAYKLQQEQNKPRQQESAEKQNMDFLDRLEEKFKVSNGNDAIDPNSERYKRMLELERELEGDD